MKFDATFVLLAASCGGMLVSPGCSLLRARVAPVTVATPARSAPSPPAAPEEPISVPQTQVILPRPQPIAAGALAIIPDEWPAPAPEPPVQPAKPHPAARAERNQPNPTQPVGPQPPPPRRRIRPVATAAEQQRLSSLIAEQQRQAQDILAKAKARQLSDSEKGTVERIQAFLDQTEGAIKEQDLQLAEALSSRALLLSRELVPEK